MKKYLLLTFATMLFASASFSQCAQAMSIDTLNINQVSALILDGERFVGKSWDKLLITKFPKAQV